MVRTLHSALITAFHRIAVLIPLSPSLQQRSLSFKALLHGALSSTLFLETLLFHKK